jgi:hypothetical protein
MMLIELTQPGRASASSSASSRAAAMLDELVEEAELIRALIRRELNYCGCFLPVPFVLVASLQMSKV